MTMSSKVLLQLALSGVTVGLLIGSSDGNPAIGTWKLNVAQSKSSTGSLPKSATRTVEPQGNGISISYEFVEPDGSIDKYSYVASFDDHDAPISGTGASNWRQNRIDGAESIAVRREASNVFAEALKKSGGVVMTTRTVVSKKGAVTIITANGADAQGQPTKDVLVWDKQ